MRIYLPCILCHDGSVLRLFRHVQNIPLHPLLTPQDIINAEPCCTPIKCCQNRMAALSHHCSVPLQDVKASSVKDESAVEIVPLPASAEDGESITIYVKNLAWATTDAGLQVCRTSRPSCKLSLGGHAEFMDSSVADLGFKTASFGLHLKAAFHTAKSCCSILTTKLAMYIGKPSDVTFSEAVEWHSSSTKISWTGLLYHLQGWKLRDSAGYVFPPSFSNAKFSGISFCRRTLTQQSAQQAGAYEAPGWQNARALMGNPCRQGLVLWSAPARTSPRLPSPRCRCSLDHFATSHLPSCAGMCWQAMPD